MTAKDQEYFAARTREEIGKRVRALDGSGHEGVITGGDFENGQWQVRCEDGVTRTFKGPDLQERSGRES